MLNKLFISFHTVLPLMLEQYCHFIHINMSLFIKQYKVLSAKASDSVNLRWAWYGYRRVYG